MLKRVQAFMLALAMVLTFGYLNCTTVQAADVELILNKKEYLAGETLEVKVNGVPEEWVDNGAFVASFVTSSSAEDFEMYEFLDEGDNLFNFEGFLEEGLYEIRIYSCDEPTLAEELIASVTFTVGGSAWGVFTMVTDADEYADGEDLEITISGVPEFMIDNYAFVGIYEIGAAFDNPYDYDFIADAEIENVVTLLAPSEPGIYEVRAYSTDNVISENQLVALHEVVYMPPIDAEEYEEEGDELPESARIIFMHVGSETMLINGEIVEVDPGYGTIPALTPEGRVIVPIRAVVTALDGNIAWDGEKQELTMEANDNTVVMTIGSTSYLVNGEERTMDVAPEIINDRTMIPLRAAGEALNCSVNWIGEEQEIQIFYFGE